MTNMKGMSDMDNSSNVARTASNVCSVIYFVLVLLPWVVLGEPLMMIWQFAEIFSAFGGLGNIALEAIQSVWILFLCIFVAAAISMVIPGFWPMYRKLPWLLPYVVIGFVDVFVLALDMQVMYASGSILLTVLFLVAARAVECVLLYKFPIPVMRPRRKVVAE